MAPRNKLGKQLTDTALRNGQKGNIFREDGLEFRFFEKGQAGVRYVGRMAGTNKRLAFALGRYPTLNLKAARIAGEKARADCKQGIDPRHALAAQAKAQEQLTGLLLEEYLNSRTSDRPTTRKDKTNTLRPALHGWKKRPIRSITKADITRLLDTYSDRPATKRKLYAYLSHFFEWAAERELIETNPCERIRPPKPVPRRERVLTDGEIAALMGMSGSIWGSMLQIMLLVANRGIEVCKMRRSEIDLANQTWTIPAGTFKQGRLHVVPLSEAACQIIANEIAQRPTGWGDFIFGVGSDGKAPYNGRSNGMDQVRRRTETSGWSGHDCRRTAITLMQKLGIPKEVRTAITGQGQSRDGASVYEHYGYAKEAKEGVELLAAEIHRITSSIPDDPKLTFASAAPSQEG